MTITDRLNAEIAARKAADLALGTRVTKLEAQVAAIILAQPVLVPRAVEVTTTLTASNTKADFQTACANLSYDAVLLSNAAGNFNWQDVRIDVDRTSNPLEVRPVAGHAVVFDGNPTTSGIIISVGQTILTKYLTLTGRSGSWTFQDHNLAQSAVIEPRGSDNCSFTYLTFQNIRRDATVLDSQPYKSYCFYISGAGAGSNSNLLIDNCRFKAPAVYRDVSCMQIASSGSHSNITISNVLEMTNYHYGLSVDVPVTGMLLDTWTMTDTGRTATPASIRFFPANINGTYKNIAATLSDPLLNNSTGTVTNGGGNSGI